MVRKKLDERVRTLLERGVATGQRSMLVLVGDHGKDQVPNLHHILSRASIRARPKVLWCYKKELGFSTHRKKRMKKIKRDKARGLAKGTSGSSEDQSADNFELFVSSTDVEWCYYRDSHRVLGTTVGVLVLQDFEALTPNLMARTIETVEGGGLIVFLMRTVKSLRQLYAMSMDVHSRYRTETSGDVVPRFNERFILSLGKCPNCLVCDDELNVLPLSKSALRKLGDAGSSSGIHKGDGGEVLSRRSSENDELDALKESLRDTPHVGAVAELARTLDQARAVLTFLEACSERTSKSTVALTAARGRGKSSAVGLCLAGAISLGYSNVVVTAPEPENLVAVFDFCLRGLKALKYQEHLDYAVQYNSNAGRDSTKCVVGIEIHRDHRQTIRYYRPDETDKFASAEIVAIDEAAAIPLPVVKRLMTGGDRITFMSSTVNGYEGTGRALSLKLVKELRDAKGGKGIGSALAAAGAVAGAKSKKGEAKVHEKRWAAAAEAASNVDAGSTGGPLREIELSSPIRYSPGDPIESWLNKLLCLDCGTGSKLALRGGAPAPSECELYSVDRDALFSYHKLSEAFLQKLMGLYTSAHYKNTPNDLQMLSDAPAHSVFVLLSPSAEQDSDSLPDVLAVIQVALEGKISRKSVEAQLARGHRSAGDLIPWTISQQFGDSNFARLSGARVVRIAVHPNAQGMGYGSRAVELLTRFYNGDMVNLAAGAGDGGDDEDGSDSDDNGGGSETPSSDEDDAANPSPKGKGIRGERLNPRKELPPLLLPLTEIPAPRLDWLGTSFGLTPQLHKFWRRAGMRTLYLRQTRNELTGEHSSVLVRALPKRSGYDDAWLPAFAADARRRLTSLLGGAFQDMNVRLAISVLEDLDGGYASRGNEEAAMAIRRRAGGSSSASTEGGGGGKGSGKGTISAEELNYFLTPHDLKRLEQYGRNLSDHHLVSDLLPPVASLYFSGKLGPDVKLSSVQCALLCGAGLQRKTMDELTGELGLPGNQTLAMFNKAIRKLSIALNGVVEEAERSKLLGGKERIEAERKAEKMRNVSRQTLEEDEEEGAKVALATLKGENSNLPPEIAGDIELMQYAVKGTEKEWADALKDKKEDGETTTAGNLQIKTTEKKKKREKRKALTEEDMRREMEASDPSNKKSSSSSASKSKNKKKSRKSKS